MDYDEDNENDVLCEKIINDVHGVYLNDPDLSSFEIIPTIHQCNRSPVKHVEHHLGLDAWCTKHVYDHAHRILMLYKRQYASNYLQKSETLVKYLNIALLINPDVVSFWHMRRKLVQNTRLSINREFQFTTLTLSKKPKSSEAFAYRRWLFSFQSAESIDWRNEIGICDRCADRSSNNYHAWSHRQWVLHNDASLIKSELLLSEKFMQKHFSDYSCCFYRQYLIKHAYEQRYYDPEEMPNLLSLKELLNRHLIENIKNSDELLTAMLPTIDLSEYDGMTGIEKRIKSFLYCCNLAAHDMLLMDAQTNKYLEREAFNLHRRAMLKFIVDESVHLLIVEKILLYMPPPTYAEAQNFQMQLKNFDFQSNRFLGALERSESLLGEKHRDWCSIYLGFYKKVNSNTTPILPATTS